MSNLPVIDNKDAKPESAALLNEVEKKFGFVPNLMRVIASSPTALQAYLNLSELVEKTHFTPEEQQAILLAVSVENNCDYCVAAHSMVAVRMAGMSPDRLKLLREGNGLGHEKLDSLVEFTREVVRMRGFASEKAVSQFFAAGFSKEQLLEVLVCITMKTLSNYTNHIAETPLDQPFSDFKWSRNPTIPSPIGHGLG